MEAFSSTSSAYIRFSFAFSVPSSLKRPSSETLVALYFGRQFKYNAGRMPCLRTTPAIGIAASSSFRMPRI